MVPDKPYGEIYVITCRVSGKQYVGQTIRGVKTRWQEHKSLTSRCNPHLRNAMKLYGTDNFDLKIVDTAGDLDELNLKEVQWISQLNTFNPNGYNLTTGGDSGKKISRESIEKTRKANLGRKRSDDTRAKMRSSWHRTTEGAERIRRAHLGHKHTEETKEKIRVLAKNRLHTPQTPEHTEKIRQANLGQHRSPEAKAKMSLAALNRGVVSQETRKKQSLARMGKPRTPETRARMAEARRTWWAKKKLKETQRLLEVSTPSSKSTPEVAPV